MKRLLTTLTALFLVINLSAETSKYERVLMTTLRDENTSTAQFRRAAEKLAEILVSKVVECLPTEPLEITTPVSICQGESFATGIELVSVMRSGDALLDVFHKHFPDAPISKFLVQRDEKTAEPHFKYMKPSPTLANGNRVVITEPMIATGGSLDMVFSMLIEQGVKEENILVASVCVAPEGLERLKHAFPKVQFVMTVLDEKLNDKKYIVPGLGDFGDRFFGTVQN